MKNFLDRCNCDEIVAIIAVLCALCAFCPMMVGCGGSLDGTNKQEVTAQEAASYVIPVHTADEPKTMTTLPVFCGPDGQLCK